MLSFDPSILDKFKAEYTFEADLIELQSFNVTSEGTSTSVTDYLTNADTELYYNGNRYRQVPFEVPDVPSILGMNVNLIEIEFANADLFFTSYFLNQDRQGDLTILSKYYEENVVAPYMAGHVETWKVEGDRAVLVLSNELAVWQKKTLRYPTPKCAWPFVIAPECGYSGPSTWCDRTVERCIALGNYSNFGGRKFILKMQDKRIFWGEKET